MVTAPPAGLTCIPVLFFIEGLVEVSHIMIELQFPFCFFKKKRFFAQTHFFKFLMQRFHLQTMKSSVTNGACTHRCTACTPDRLYMTRTREFFLMHTCVAQGSRHSELVSEKVNLNSQPCLCCSYLCVHRPLHRAQLKRRSSASWRHQWHG